MFEKLKALWKVKKLIDQGNKEVVMLDGVKRLSWFTGEFWITLLGNAPMIACTLKGHESIPCLALSAIVNLIYIYKRGTLKEKLIDLGLKAAKDVNATTENPDLKK